MSGLCYTEYCSIFLVSSCNDSVLGVGGGHMYIFVPRSDVIAVVVI